MPSVLEEVTFPESDIRRIVSRVESADAGVRLDLWLSRRFTYLSRNAWQNSVERGAIRVNERLVRPSRRLNAGDSVAYLPPPECEEPPVDPSVKVVLESETYLVLSKSGNLPSHPAGPYFNNTLWGILRPRYGNVHLVTRLDRETSGLVLCAFDGREGGKLSQAVSAPNAEKVYYAMVHGAFERAIDAEGFLFRDAQSPVMKKRAFSREKPPESAGVSETARTLLTPVSVSNNGRFSLVCARLETGRLHQIRATLCSSGFPLAGDKIYGLNDRLYLKMIAGQLSALEQKMLEMPRQALHAARLKFTEPVSNEEVSFAISLPEDMLSCCRKHQLFIPPELES